MHEVYVELGDARGADDWDASRRGLAPGVGEGTDVCGEQCFDRRAIAACEGREGRQGASVRAGGWASARAKVSCTRSSASAALPVSR